MLKIVMDPPGREQELELATRMLGGNGLNSTKIYDYAGPAAAGVVVGAKVPIVLTSRADDEHARLFSCAVALLYAHWQATGVSAVTAISRAPIQG